MKNRLIVYSIVLLVISFGCSSESEVDKAWKNIDATMDKERLETQIRDTLNISMSRTPYNVANEVNNLFKNQKLNYQDSAALNITSLKSDILEIEGIPDICRDVILEIFSEENINFTFHLDSAQSKIIDCLFIELLE